MKSTISLILLASAALLKAASCRAFIRADPATTDPNDDPFYAQPANIASFAQGAVIDSRRVYTTINTFSESYQLKYRTTDGQGRAVSTVATLWIPVVPRNPPSVFSYQYAEDALNLDCAPSWAWVQNSGSQNTGPARVEGPFVVPWGLNRGYYVIQPDAEGPASSWLVGNMEGKAVLDAVRATINYKNLDRSRTQVGLYGYSGGAHSTVWAAELSGTYASDLNIVGASFGGTPIDLQAALDVLNKGPEALLAGGALFGLAQGYPALETNYQTGAEGLTSYGKSVAVTLRSRNYCLNGHQDEWKGTDWNTLFKKPLSQNPTLQSVLKRESLLSNVSSIGVPVPKFPRYQYHGTKDTTVPYWPESAYVQQQCQGGAKIKFETYNDDDHAGAAVKGLQNALDFVGRAFDGTSQTCACGTTVCTP